MNTGEAARRWLAGEGTVDLVVIDAASMRSSGARIWRSIHRDFPDPGTLLISDPDRLPARDIAPDVHLVHPFTSRKLINRLKLFQDGEGNGCLKAGPLLLDPERQVLRCRDREELITPKLVHLLELLIEHQGDVVERDILFRKVWGTNYTGDTRTLDVHISWLRKIIEQDPRDPELLLTRRGVGYKLDL